MLASGVVISLTALTTGLSPAVAQPGSDDVVTTTVVPEPEYTAPEPEATAEETATVPEGEAPAQSAAPSQPAPQTPQTLTQAPVVTEPAPEPAAEPEPQTQAPKTSTAVQTAEPSSPATEPSTTAQRSPAATTEPGTATSAPATKASEPTADAPASSAALTPASGTSGAPTPGGTETATESRESETAEATAEATAEQGQSETPTVSIEQAATEIETLVPETLEAPAEDIQLARNAKPIIEQEPAPAPEQDLSAFKSSIETSLKIPGLDIGYGANSEVGLGGSDIELVSNVRQWRPDWIEYDEFYRPVIMNPFRAPVRLVYMYEMAPRIVFIPPLARIVLQAAQFAAYSFTAAVLNPINAAIDTVQALTEIAVGSFFGGGYFPGAGLPLPAPPPVLRYDNVPVLVNYPQARYEPFRVRQIVDVGEDRVYGGRKVLLDGATPVWGEWTQTAAGERQFEVHKTQQFPGLSEPVEGPLPGDYRLRLAADEDSTGGLTGRDIFLMVAAGVIGTLGFGAIGLAFFLGRRRPEH
ncbi:hypothetical protein [Mycobacterium sp. IDR2000157661]|uniref:hypothetical protein n=1 Tax=Mycobacterium sp. IDR2000157661 TaxID=2867005 RepID=UPI001EEA018A|nr:hypothetical protein [Mycobacterium sp. IDR2000157661]